MKQRKLNIKNRSGYRGVSWHTKSQKWLATYCINGNRYYLGYHATVEQAHKVQQAYIAAFKHR